MSLSLSYVENEEGANGPRQQFHQNVELDNDGVSGDDLEGYSNTLGFDHAQGGRGGLRFARVHNDLNNILWQE